MENASKALIIAGAILLAILIIGLGMLIFNQAKEALGNTGMTQQQISTYNAEFQAYEGKFVSGTKTRSLFDLVRNHNLANQDDNTLKISINGKDDPTGINSEKAKIKAGKNYQIVLSYDNITGYVTSISANQVGSVSNSNTNTNTNTNTVP